MKTPHDCIAFSLLSSKKMLDVLTSDLSGSDWVHRAAPNSNCAAWLIGHLILTDRRALGNAGVTELPELPAAFETTFGRENNAPLAETFGDPAVLMPMFDRHRDLLISAVTKLPLSRFEETVPRPSPRFTTFGEYFSFMGLHAIMHAGQISTIRRSLGRPPLF